MTRRFPGSIIRAASVAPSSSAASGIWTLPEALNAKQAGTWPTRFDFGTVRSVTNDSNTGDLNGNTWRVVLLAAGLTAPTGSPAVTRVTFAASTANNFVITKAYIGHRAAAGDTYDFAATPVQLTWDGGSTSKTIAISGTALSDHVNFAWDKTSGIIISIYVATSGSHARQTDDATAAANIAVYSKAGDDAATVDATGYSLTVDNTFSLGISLIETDGF